MSVRLAQAFYEGEPDELYCYERPDWYLRGIGRFRGPTGELEVANMLAYLKISEPGDEITEAVAQIDVEPKRLSY